MHKRTARLGGVLAAVLVTASIAVSVSSGGSLAQTATVKIPKKTICYVEPAAVDEVTNRNVSQMKASVKRLGWTLKFTNALGDFSVVNKAIQSCVNSKVDAIITGSTDAALVRAPLTAAKKAGIPAIVIGGGVAKDPLYVAQYTENEKLMSTLLTKFMVKDLGGSGDIAAINISQLTSGSDRKVARDAVLKGTGIKVVAQQDGDLADPIKGTQTIAANMITANPDLKAFWLVYDYMSGPTVTALQNAGLNGKVKIYTWFAGPDNVARLRDSSTGLRALVEDSFDKTALVALDQLANHFVNKKPIDPKALVKNPLKYAVVTTANAPAPGKLMFPLPQNAKPFWAKWAKGKFG
jgi:ABC-type sugar transport system substrate-binding protein